MSGDGRLMRIYRALHEAFGHRDWWPARTPFEVIVGAILTQNTNWRNVERAIENLREAGLLSAELLACAEPERVRELIRPAGCFRQKTGRLLRIARWVGERCPDGDDDLEGLRGIPCDELRAQLLVLKGIGPETADSIVLYAVGMPVFVVDAYTVRVMGRHGFIGVESGYGDIQAFFQDELPADVGLFQDFHAQFVELGKRYCKKRGPLCAECPLHPLLGDPDEMDEGA